MNLGDLFRSPRKGCHGGHVLVGPCPTEQQPGQWAGIETAAMQCVPQIHARAAVRPLINGAEVGPAAVVADEPAGLREDATLSVLNVDGTEPHRAVSVERAAIVRLQDGEAGPAQCRSRLSVRAGPTSARFARGTRGPRRRMRCSGSASATRRSVRARRHGAARSTSHSHHRGRRTRDSIHPAIILQAIAHQLTAMSTALGSRRLERDAVSRRAPCAATTRSGDVDRGPGAGQVRVAAPDRLEDGRCSASVRSSAPRSVMPRQTLGAGGRIDMLSTSEASTECPSPWRSSCGIPGRWRRSRRRGVDGDGVE